MKIQLKQVRLDGDTQPRQFINEDVVNEYSELLLDDKVLPPVDVFHDGANYWLADGFHRYFANKKAGFLDIEATIHEGTRRDAILFSVGTNSSHGLRRTNEDKRKAVLTLVNDLEWSEWSDSEIARRCHVSSMTVGRIKKSMNLETTEVKYKDKHGNVSTMKKPEAVTLKPLEKMVEPQDDKLHELAVAHQELAEENAKLLDKLAVQNMDGSEEDKQAAADTIADLRAQIKTLEAENRALKVSRDQLQAKNADMLKQLNYYKKKVDKQAA
ncbi:MAG: ParB N-terminal domain-containing protein [Fluviibacter sp.]